MTEKADRSTSGTGKQMIDAMIMIIASDADSRYQFHQTFISRAAARILCRCCTRWAARGRSAKRSKERERPRTAWMGGSSSPDDAVTGMEPDIVPNFIPGGCTSVSLSQALNVVDKGVAKDCMPREAGDEENGPHGSDVTHAADTADVAEAGPSQKETNCALRSQERGACYWFLTDVNQRHSARLQQDSIAGGTGLGQVLHGGSPISGQDVQKNVTDLEIMQQIVAQMPPKHLDLPKYQMVLGHALQSRYDESGDLKDLQATLQAFQAAVDLTPDNDTDKAGRLQSLAESFTDRYQRLGNLRDLEAALQNNQEAVKLTPEDHPDKASRLQSLAVAFSDRYRRLGNIKDLDAGLQYSQEVVKLTPEDHPNMTGRLQNLAVFLTDRYQRLGNVQDLESALHYAQEAVQLTPEDHPDKAARLQSLAVAFSNRYKRLGNLQDLQAALQHTQEAVKLTPKEHPAKAGRLQNLAAYFTSLYQRLGNLADLEAALQYAQEAVKLTPEDHPKKAGRLQNLAIAFTDRYQSLGNLQDLEAALNYKREAVNLTPQDHPAKASRLQSLAVSFRDRYQRIGSLQDLEAALQCAQEAVKLTPDNHPDKASRLRDLAVSFSDRYQRLGSLQDLEAALQYDQEAVKLTPDNHPDKASRLQSLAISFRDRYQQLGSLQDLEEALRYDQEAVKLTPEDHPDKAGRLQSLAVFFTDRYRSLGNLQDLEAALQHKWEARLGDMEDLKAAIQHNQTAVNLTPADHPDKASRLQNLAVFFHDRYQRLGNLQDLEAALQYNQEAVKLTPEDHPDKAHRLQSLAVAFSDRYQTLGKFQDLEAALQYGQEAVKLTPEDHPDKASRLRNLAISFTERYKRLGDLQDLEAALKYKRKAVNLTPQDHPDKANRLQSLAVSFRDRYQRLGNLQDLEAALQYDQEAVKLTPEDHPEKAIRLQSLAGSLVDRYKRSRTPKGLQDIHQYYSSSFNIVSSSPEESWKAALRWGLFAAQFQPTHCITAYKAAFSLLPELLWIEILEQGLATTFQQMLQLKISVDGLPDEQAQEFHQLSMKLYSEGSDDSMSIVNRRNHLIKEIRNQPGFEFFLLPKPYNALRHAAQQGPVVILNSHKESCDGIIILNPTSDPVHVAFPNVTLDLLHSHSVVLKGLCGHRVRGESVSTRLFGYKEGFSSPKERFANMLTWLWTHIVEPVYKTLEAHDIHGGRLWWLPTGAFTGLPLHACSPTTLGSLVEAYNKTPSGINKLGVVGVTQTDSKGVNYLKGVGQEVESILSIVPEPFVSCFHGAQATVDAVKTLLQNCSWIHLACHGTQDLIQPTKSHLLLYEGNLELDTILRMPLQNAEVVFLAACQTAMGDSELVNESFHLGGGFIAAGFQGAIGTLWSMQDQDGPLVAKAVYSHLFRNGRQPQATDAAEALHLAVKNLREKNVSYERWVPFIHMGI
ncbi:CHAT domain-containing protein [Mycena pura]|uniref:CHAT domain-containing protein n=1 Tax=Mycena pura TaxID=153505 RepID=A0AAD6VKU4_9AGAR|nr:CHAT domain-containing protein [Mycena pura]